MARLKGDHQPARSLDELERRIGIRLRDHARLERALTHSSLRVAAGGRRGPNNSRKGGKPPEGASAEDGRSYERLEFLGDRVLGLVIAEKRCSSMFPQGRARARLSLRLNCAGQRPRPVPRLPTRLGLCRLHPPWRRRQEGEGLENEPATSAPIVVESLIAAIYLGEWPGRSRGTSVIAPALGSDRLGKRR